MLALISHRSSVRLAEVGFLLILLAGAWLAVAEVPALKLRSTRTLVGGIALAAAGLLLVIAVHWGKFS